MGAEVPKKALHVHVHVQVFHQAFDACTKVKRQSTENEKKKGFLQFFCFSFSLSHIQAQRARALTRSLFLFPCCRYPLHLLVLPHGARQISSSFSSFSSSSLPYLRYLNVLFAFPKSTSTDVRQGKVAIRGHPPLLSPGGCSTHPSFHRYMYLSKANKCLPGAKSWIRTRALHSVDGGTRERSYENVF